MRWRDDTGISTLVMSRVREVLRRQATLRSTVDALHAQAALHGAPDGVAMSRWSVPGSHYQHAP
jgi:hypothetical protein